MGKNKRNTPLRAAYDDGELVIRIGVDALAGAISNGNDFHRFDDAKDEYIRDFAISNTAEFARDVALAMQHEAEDGSSPLTKFLDEMARVAIDDGSTGVEFNQEIAFGKKHRLETW